MQPKPKSVIILLIRYTVFFSFLFLFVKGDIVFAQKASFTVDKSGGCSPLTVSFTNTSTGFSGSASYKWDLGNGNTSALINPGATYKDEKDYTVTLTVTDAGKTYTQTTTITVFKKPVVNFTVNITKGCLPLEVNYTSSSNAGDGTIDNYFWDFGDGTTGQGAAFAQTPHTYSTPQSVTAGLTVTNSHGCYNTLKKADIVKVLSSVKADFSASQNVLCQLKDASKFINTSTGPGTLTYKWDFGDGSTESIKEPSHVYNKKGIYTVKLAVKSSEGCEAELTKEAFINAANFSTDYDVPSLVCQNNAIDFFAKTNSTADYTRWYVDGAFSSSSYQLTYAFDKAKTYKVSLVNIYGACSDTVTKNITVNASPVVNGFVADLQGACGAPVTVKFKDTTKNAVSWAWDFNYNYYYNFNTASTDQSTSHNFTDNGYYDIALKVTNAAGCSSIIARSISIDKPYATISASPNLYTVCTGSSISFSANSNIDIQEYNWDFGDGGTSKEANPKHIFNKAGYTSVTLNYVNKNGCKDVAVYSVNVTGKPKFDFSSNAGTTICGNTPVYFSVTGSNTEGNYYWDFGDNSYYGNTQDNMHQYYYDSVYTVSLIINNYGCSDTVTKKDYLKVLPPFPKISEIINTCDGTRGLVTFKETSQKTNKWSWDFGDGNSTNYNDVKSEVNNTYKKTGSYKVVLTATNGNCAVKDSVTAYVLLKQNPLLASDQTSVCTDAELHTTLSNMETNPAPYYYYYYDYSVPKIEYRDGSSFTGNWSTTDGQWTNPFHLNFNYLDNNKKDLRVITNSYYFNCPDTSNYIPVTTKGPEAGFDIPANEVCFKSPLSLKDTSKSNNGIPIVKWQWNYGDGKEETFTTGGTINHKYDAPGWYYVNLKVTDKDGCTNTTQSYNNVQLKGPKANFSVNPNPASPGTDIYFYNSTDNFDVNSYSTEYLWNFGDGTTATDNYYLSHQYAESGVDTVTLIATNKEAACSDTSVQYVHIKNLNLSYTYTMSYVNPNSSCPPVLASFTNTSVNTNSVKWDFGDGTTADNLNYPSHTYEKPGVYKVTIYGYFDDGKMDSSFDYITIKGPYAILKANKLFSCGADAVTLNAEVKNTTSFTWDFGDGTLLDISDTFAVHQYLTPGVYTPALIVKDALGCSSSFFLETPIVIDTLHFDMKNNPAVICDSAQVIFSLDITSVARNQLQNPLTYYWNFGTGNINDTASSETPSFVFTETKKYPVSLKAVSPYGCIYETTDTIVVKPKSRGVISGPSEICENGYATFTATASINNDKLKWLWLFEGTNSSAQQNPPVQQFAKPGNDTVRLIINNDGCLDTSIKTVIVHANPVINISPENPRICVGASVQLTAHDGNKFEWITAGNISDPLLADPFVFPAADAMYSVKVTNESGCENRDSVKVSVVQKFKVNLASESYACKGSNVQLEATGADVYHWLNGSGLSDTNISNPFAVADTETSYTVVGNDAYGCFADTAVTTVKVLPLPFVDAGADIVIPVGSVVELHTTNSNDVTDWEWQPSTYLNCSNCASPASTPRSDITYEVTVKTANNCIAKDSIKITLVCTSSTVNIPAGFTPNGDGLNDRFYVAGKGIKTVKHFVIFDRWGRTIFSKNNINANDYTTGWDGSYAGQPLDPGTFVYIAEILCDTGDVFSYKGTVTLIR